jgi:hypothetical protein
MDEPLHFSHVRTPSTLRAHNNLSTALKDTGQAAACKCTIGSTHVDSLTVLDLEMVEINVSALAMHLSLAIDEEIDLSSTQTNPVMPRSVTNAASFRHKLCLRLYSPD